MSATDTILRILAASPTPMYGLDIVRQSDGAVSRGAVYVDLSRLEDDGFVDSEQEPVTTVPGMPRRLYRITAVGRRVL